MGVSSSCNSVVSDKDLLRGNVGYSGEIEYTHKIKIKGKKKKNFDTDVALK